MRKYIEIFKIEIKKNIAYRFQIWARLLGDVVFMVMWYCVWRGLYGNPSNVYNHVEFQQTIFYIMVAQFLITINNAGSPMWPMEGKISSGDIVNELIKPYSYIAKCLVECGSSSFCYFAFSSIWVFTGVILVLKIEIPLSPIVWFLFVVSAVLGYLIRFFIELAFSFLSFWLIHIQGIRALFTFFISVISGSVIPLYFFPAKLSMIARILPFQSIYYIPCQIATGTVEQTVCIQQIALQIFWLVFSIVLAKCVWALGKRKMVVQGG